MNLKYHRINMNIFVKTSLALMKFMGLSLLSGSETVLVFLINAHDTGKLLLDRKIFSIL